VVPQSHLTQTRRVTSCSRGNSPSIVRQPKRSPALHCSSRPLHPRQLLLRPATKVFCWTLRCSPQSQRTNVYRFPWRFGASPSTVHLPNLAPAMQDLAASPRGSTICSAIVSALTRCVGQRRFRCFPGSRNRLACNHHCIYQNGSVGEHKPRQELVFRHRQHELLRQGTHSRRLFGNSVVRMRASGSSGRPKRLPGHSQPLLFGNLGGEACREAGQRPLVGVRRPRK
jgi:hypothetical protein